MGKDDEKAQGCSNLSRTSKELIRVCKFIIQEAREGRCDNEEIATFLCEGLPASFGYFREDDYVTADEAMRILHLNQNRNKFFALLKEHKINACKFKGLRIGYRIKDIYRLKHKLETINE